MIHTLYSFDLGTIRHAHSFEVPGFRIGDLIFIRTATFFQASKC